VEHSGYRFDIGGHRFFTKVPLINEWWNKILDDDFLICSRLSRIYYKGKFFDYPLKPFNAIAGLGPVEAVRIVFSYIAAQISPHSEEKTFEQWVSNRFGRRLYEVFFQNYTEKVWGMKCSEIGADWAAQRIKNLNLHALLRNMFLRSRDDEITTLIRQFRYPRLGPGMMWERVAQILDERGHPIRFGVKVEKIHLSRGKITSVTIVDDSDGESRLDGQHFISTMPIKNLIAALDPPPPDAVLDASRKLRYRDFLTVGLVVDTPDVFKDNWIYIHSPDVKVGRIQNFKNWSPDMVPDLSKTSLGLEYFVQENDDLWSSNDQELIKLATDECAQLGLVNAEDVVDGVVIRMPKAYPVYDRSYMENVKIIREYLDSIPNLQLIGRNGQHRYNNQDHSMLTGIYAARNLCGERLDIWDINTEDDYHEEGSQQRSGERLVPKAVRVVDPLTVLRSAFARYDPIALGVALSAVFGLGLFCLMTPLIASDNGAKLSLLKNYFLGFESTWAGAAVGLLQISIYGFVLGFVMAHMINYLIGWHEQRLFRKLAGSGPRTDQIP
jgi:protoporphyrinogen oxidase